MHILFIPLHVLTVTQPLQVSSLLALFGKSFTSKMTRRTSTTQESRFSLVFFEIDDTYSIVETRRLEASVSGAEIIRGAKVRVKSGKEFFEAEIIEQSSSKTDLDYYYYYYY